METLLMEKLKFLWSNLWDFVAPFIKVLMSQAGPILAAAAIKAVTFCASTDMANDTKRQVAFDAILEDLGKQGIKLGTSVINMAIEAAVLKIKENN